MSPGQRLKLLEEHPHFAQAFEIVRRLARDGHTTVFAGGCVRDGLLGVKPKDLDLATSALPDEVERSFERTLAVGKAFGTVIVVKEGRSFEVTTFRADGPYLDGRHPSSVSFTGIEEDAKRRDFTVNALFYDPLEKRVLDFTGGQDDLARGILRAVGKAGERFAEDRLRMLRAVRFVGQLGFELDKESAEAIRRDFAELGKVSVERIFNETRRLLESNYLIKGMGALLASRQERVFWPELSGLDTDRLLVFPKFINWENAFAAVCHIQNVSDPEPRLKAWKAPRDSSRRIQAQLEALKTFADARATRAARARIFGSEIYAETVVLLQGLFDENRIKKWVAEYLEIADDEGRLPKPFLTGEDLLRMGIPPGQKMGELIRKLFDAQLEARVRSRPEALSELKKLT
jgi:tRNA nucleotidyltransferase/poly(A) polymerase